MVTEPCIAQLEILCTSACQCCSEARGDILAGNRYLESNQRFSSVSPMGLSKGISWSAAIRPIAELDCSSKAADSRPLQVLS